MKAKRILIIRESVDYWENQVLPRIARGQNRVMDFEADYSWQL